MKITLLLILFLSGVNAYSQELCGTRVTPQIVARERASLLPPAAATINAVPKYCLGKTLSITFWVVKDKTGQANILPADLTAAVNALNIDFAPVCLSFNVCAINYIDDWNYDSLYFPDERDQLLTLYQTPKTINVYMSRVIYIDPTTAVGGLGALPPGADAIWLTKGSLSGKTFSHEMGHFFGLYHTFETQFGNELADGSNCTLTGDLVCDTPADPGGSNSADCQLSPYTQDSNGDWYVPHIGNIMSYYDDSCTCGFTNQQYDRMCEKYLALRFYLW